MQGLPITGRAFGDATARGQFPLIDLHGNARITGGTVGPLRLDTANLALHTAGNRIVIDSAEMRTPDISATAAGSLSLRPASPLDIHVHAATDRLAQVIYDVSRVRVPLSGSFESTLKIGGTYRAPTFLAGFDATDVVAYGLPIASLFGEVHLQQHALVISNAGATFAHGEATLAGSLPLQLSPLRLAAPDQPISFDLDVVGLDPSIFNDTSGQRHEAWRPHRRPRRGCPGRFANRRSSVASPLRTAPTSAIFSGFRSRKWPRRSRSITRRRRSIVPQPGSAPGRSRARGPSNPLADSVPTRPRSR